MHIKNILVPCALLLTSSCTSVLKTPNDQQPEVGYVELYDSKTYFSDSVDALEFYGRDNQIFNSQRLRQIAEEVVRDNNLTFDFSKAKMSVRVYEERSPILATIVFNVDVIGPMLEFRIDRDGTPIRHFMGYLDMGLPPKNQMEETP